MKRRAAVQRLGVHCEQVRQQFGVAPLASFGSTTQDEATNELFLQASLVASEALSTRFTLPAGHYIMGIFCYRAALNFLTTTGMISS